ncbi:hypothetical protein F25303_1460 [Fusarium sp. NRRL 25303]|nr:hypothetical protein F25303_1460 [Fusarium sp. NRRL 25303]
MKIKIVVLIALDILPYLQTDEQELGKKIQTESEEELKDEYDEDEDEDGDEDREEDYDDYGVDQDIHDDNLLDTADGQ